MTEAGRSVARLRGETSLYQCWEGNAPLPACYQTKALPAGILARCYQTGILELFGNTLPPQKKRGNRHAETGQ